MSELTEESHFRGNNEKTVIRGELALAIVILINSLGVVLMLYSGSGISAISSVPYAFSRVFPNITLGTWTYIFQGILILSLMVMRKRLVFGYLGSFLVGFAFSKMLDLYEAMIHILPSGFGFRVIYFVISYLLISFGIALANRCGLPIIPTDLFPRELADITKLKYARIKIGFDVSCLAVTGILTLLFLGHMDGLGIGTIIAAFTVGKAVAVIGKWMDRHVQFCSFMTERHV